MSSLLYSPRRTTKLSYKDGFSNDDEPTQCGGVGRIEGEVCGGLQGRLFVSQCPPVVTPHTIIIAVCGPNDYMSNAALTQDGWFFSDFYLFHHPFKDTATRQYWLTCVSPNELVHKYKELAHGDPRSSGRRVVWEERMKNDVKDVLTFNPKDLLDQFLSYLATPCKEVKGAMRPVLALIFGHGMDTTFAITIGGSGEFRHCPTLTRQKFKEAILRYNPNPNVCLLTTACYGGGWAQTSFLNITAMSGTTDEEVLLSWPESTSLGHSVDQGTLQG